MSVKLSDPIARVPYIRRDGVEKCAEIFYYHGESMPEKLGWRYGTPSEGDIFYVVRGWYEAKTKLYNLLREELEWSETFVRVHGKVHKSPRLVHFMGDQSPVQTSSVGDQLPVQTSSVGDQSPVQTSSVGDQSPVQTSSVGDQLPVQTSSVVVQPRTHTYSSYSHPIKPWHPAVRWIRNSIHKEIGIRYDSSLLNLYSTGSDYIAYHGDREANGPLKSVATVSLGSTRRFYLKDNQDNSVIKTELHPGDLVIMTGELQNTHKHSVPKQVGVGPRISITMRVLAVDQ